MENILEQLTQNPHHNYTEYEIIKWRKIIKELFELHPHEIKNVYLLKQSTKIAFLFFRWKKYYFSIEELKKLLRLNEVWIRLSEQIQDYKTNSHFYWHGWYIAWYLFRKTLQREYAEKSLKYSKKALEKYKNNIEYQIQINRNIISLWRQVIINNNGKKNKKLFKKWLKITIKKIDEQLYINTQYPNIISTMKVNNINNMKIQFQNMLKNI